MLRDASSPFDVSTRRFCHHRIRWSELASGQFDLCAALQDTLPDWIAVRSLPGVLSLEHADNGKVLGTVVVIRGNREKRSDHRRTKLMFLSAKHDGADQSLAHKTIGSLCNEVLDLHDRCQVTLRLAREDLRDLNRVLGRYELEVAPVKIPAMFMGEVRNFLPESLGGRPRGRDALVDNLAELNGEAEVTS
jgi:hypothetical protein